jgi:putative addiction module component (TIGR02574 family)
MSRMNKVSLADVLHLSVAERIQLVEDIWDSIATAAPPPSLSDAQRAELDRRLESHRENPQAGTSWPQLRKEITGRK